jgi:phosphoserine phosphatase
MQYVATLISDPAVEPLDTGLAAEVSTALADAGATVAAADWLAPARACDLAFTGADPTSALATIRGAIGGRPIDAAVLPVAGRRKRLLISDMDSTIIVNETLDDLAEYAGVGAEVAAITWQSMRGEIEFVEALETRVAMLRGLPAAMLEEAYQQVVLMPGAQTLVGTLRRHGVYTVLVSGGFKYFTTRVAQNVGFEEQEANDLEVAHGWLTGKVVPPVINRDGKVNALVRISAQHGIDIDDTLAVGDGANDLGMIARAGLGVGFRSKQIVAERAAVRIDHSDLTALLFIQGYRAEDFAK